MGKDYLLSGKIPRVIEFNDVLVCCNAKYGGTFLVTEVVRHEDEFAGVWCLKLLRIGYTYYKTHRLLFEVSLYDQDWEEWRLLPLV